MTVPIITVVDGEPVCLYPEFIVNAVQKCVEELKKTYPNISQDSIKRMEMRLYIELIKE